MIKSKKNQNDNLIKEDSLDQTGHEVVNISDDQLAYKFIVNNNDALINPEPVFTNIDDLVHQDVESQIQELDQGDDALRESLEQDISASNIQLKTLLEEDYQKKKLYRIWNKTKSGLSNFFPTFGSDPTVTKSLITKDWDNYWSLKSDRMRIKDLKNHDFNTYFELMLRNKKQYQKIWSFEIILSVFYFLMSVGFLLIVGLFTPAYQSSSQSSIAYSGNSLSSAIRGLSIVNIIVLTIPYFFLLTSFFVGINALAKNKNYHVFMLLFLAISTIIVVIGIGLTVAYFFYSIQIWAVS